MPDKDVVLAKVATIQKCLKSITGRGQVSTLNIWPQPTLG